jgi:hypothetical protein
MTATELERREQKDELALRYERTPEDLVAQVATIQRVLEAVMKEDVHYGVIPGTEKPTLLKPGAEKLCLLFRLRPKFARELREEADGHLTVTSVCSLYHIPTGDCLVEEMAGRCSTRESKYAYRKGQRVCPKCGAAAIRKNKDGKTWQCMGFGDMGGCWEKFPINDPDITGQQTGRVANPDIADQYNTVLKMADKRALVAAVLIATGASDIFAQDLEDLPEFGETKVEQKVERKAEATVDVSEQRRSLFALAKERGLSEDEFRGLMVEKTGRSKFTELTLDDIVALAYAVENPDAVDGEQQTIEEGEYE